MDENEITKEVIEERKINFRNRCCTVKAKFGSVELLCNPITMASAGLIIWALIAWALLHSSSKEYLNTVQRWITDSWTWIYIGNQFLFPVVVIMVYFRFGHIKLGLKEDKPKYGDFTYFSMLFATGLSDGMFYAGVADPIGHYNHPGDQINFWGKTTVNGKAQNAINITIFHWGIHGFAVYTIPGILISYLTYRQGLPLTMRTAFYPLIGRKIFGKTGDVIDTVAIICVMFGVATSLAIGAMMLNAGINFLTPAFLVSSSNQMILIWILTAIATVSVISGIDVGIRRLSQICFISTTILLLAIVFNENTWYILNLIVQSLGFYTQFLIGTGTYTGAFAQTGTSPGQVGSKDWMHNNTVFYWGWWLAWAPLGGIFIAQVSRGRKVRDVVLYSFILPSLFVFCWLTCFGGISINMQNQAINANINCSMYLSRGKERNTTGILSATWKKIDLLYPKVERLNCRGSAEMYFDVLNKYGGISTILHLCSILSLVLHFATSSDSASLVIDCISSNGEEHPSLVQRIFWSITEGAAGTALVYYKSNIGATSMAAFTVISGLPYTFILNFCCMGLWRVMNKPYSWRLEEDINWKMDFGNINSMELFQKTLFTIFCPWYYLGYVDIKLTSHELRFWRKMFTYLKFALLFYLWIILLCLQSAYTGIDKFGWISLLGMFAYAASLRQYLREKSDIEGNYVEDFFVTMMYPLSIIQMYIQVQPNSKEENVNVDTIKNFNADILEISV